MSKPKKHHYVPQFVLRHFADERGRLTILRTDRETSFPANVRDIGHTNLGHSIYRRNREPDHVSLEVAMSEIEGAAANVVTQLRASTVRSPSTDERELLGFLIALQWVRSRFILEVLRRTVLGPKMPVDSSGRSLGLLPIITSVLYPWSARMRGEFDPKDRFCSIVDRCRVRRGRGACTGLKALSWSSRTTSSACRG